MILLINFINLLSQALYIAVIAHVVLSYFLDPYHPARQFLDRIVGPLLNPIRRLLPPMGMFDFSPLVLLLILQFITGFVVKIFQTL